MEIKIQNKWEGGMVRDFLHGKDISFSVVLQLLFAKLLSHRSCLGHCFNAECAKGLKEYEFAQGQLKRRYIIRSWIKLLTWLCFCVIIV